jgi:hypothetical protein
MVTGREFTPSPIFFADISESLEVNGNAFVGNSRW